MWNTEAAWFWVQIEIPTFSQLELNLLTYFQVEQPETPGIPAMPICLANDSMKN